MGVGLQTLRIPNGWRIDWNTLFEEDPTEPANANGYYFGGTNLFLATHARRRRAIDIEWRTEDGRPTVGRYRMRVFPMAEAEPSATPRRRPVGELEVRWQEPLADYRMSADWTQMEQLYGRGFLPDTPASTSAWLDHYIPSDEQPRVTEAIREAVRTGTVFELNRCATRRQ